jgi:hypothetical protein
LVPRSSPFTNCLHATPPPRPLCRPSKNGCTQKPAPPPLQIPAKFPPHLTTASRSIHVARPSRLRVPAPSRGAELKSIPEPDYHLFEEPHSREPCNADIPVCQPRQRVGLLSAEAQKTIVCVLCSPLQGRTRLHPRPPRAAISISCHETHLEIAEMNLNADVNPHRIFSACLE